MTHKRHKKLLETAKGNFGGKRSLFKTAHEQWMKSGNYAYRDRRNKKREFRCLWIARINAACRENGTKYSRFIEGLKAAQCTLDRKVIADLAATDATAFGELVKKAQEALKAKAAAPAAV